MKRLLVVLGLVCLLCGDVLANDYLTRSQRRRAERNARYQPLPSYQKEDPYKYKSSFGTKYKYDLSDPSDRLMYKVDPAARIDDSVNPYVRQDRKAGQWGGGAKW